MIGFCFKCLFALDVGPLWHSKHVFRQVFNMFMHCSSHVYSVCIKCLYSIFFFHSFGLQWVPNFGVVHVSLLGSCLVYWLCILHTLLHMCISHALVMRCTLPPLVHTFATLVMPWSIYCFLILSMFCLLYASQHFVFKVFCLLFELHFLIYFVSFVHHILVHIFFSFSHSSWPLCLFMSKRGRVY